MTSRKIINSEPDETWSELGTRLMKNDADYSQFLKPDTLQYFLDKSKSCGTNIGYIVLTVITSINFLLSKSKSKIEISAGFEMNLNLFSLFVGPPSTGKSTAFKTGITEPINSIGLNDYVISNCTCSGLLKLLSTAKAAYIASPEITEFLLKVLKSDDENNLTNAAVLCKLYSGELCNEVFATTNSRSVEENLAFCILGATQLKSVAHIVSRMDNGTGFLDRFLMHVPNAILPEPEEQADSLERCSLHAFTIEKLYRCLENLDEDNPKMFYFHSDAEKTYNDMKSNFIKDVNECLKEGKPTPKTKKSEFIPKVAVALHVLEHSFQNIVRGEDRALTEEITNDEILRATYLINIIEEQKELLGTFIQDLLLQKREVKAKKQPTMDELKRFVLLSNGPVVSFRSFKNFAPRTLRPILLSNEFVQVISALKDENAGGIHTFRVHGSSSDSVVFVKRFYDDLPQKFQNEFDKNIYNTKFNGLINKIIISKNMRVHLHRHGIITDRQLQVDE